MEPPQSGRAAKDRVYHILNNCIYCRSSSGFISYVLGGVTQSTHALPLANQNSSPDLHLHHGHRALPNTHVHRHAHLRPAVRHNDMAKTSRDLRTRIPLPKGGAQSLKGAVGIISCVCTIYFGFNLYITYLRISESEVRLY